MVRVRFAPSPTGFLHLANARIALLNWMKCLSVNGQFILRIDDTDTSRSEQRYIDGILEDIAWLGINPDETVKQSERLHIYKEIIDELKEAGIVYKAYETQEELQQQRDKQIALKQPPRYKPIADESSGRKPHWRFRLSSKEVRWQDEIVGNLAFEGFHSSDPVVIREDGTLTYILASVIDDYLMKINYIIRGKDHISNTATQLQMLHVLDEMKGTKTDITFAHFPLISGLDGRVFSKREESFAIKNYRLEGVNPQILSTFLLGLGLSSSLQSTNLKDIKLNFQEYGKADLKCDPEQIWSQNAKWISSLSAAQALDWMESIHISFMEDLKSFEEYWQLIRYNVYKKSDLMHWKYVLDGSYPKVKFTAEQVNYLKDVQVCMKDNLSWEDCLKKLKVSYPNFKVYDLNVIVRKALIGQGTGPKNVDLIEFFGKDEVLKRLNNTINKV